MFLYPMKIYELSSTLVGISINVIVVESPNICIHILQGANVTTMITGNEKGRETMNITVNGEILEQIMNFLYLRHIIIQQK